MNKKVIFSVMLVCLLALSLAFIGCDNGSTGEDTYSMHGSGLTSYEWSIRGLGSIQPSELINQNLNKTVVAQFIAALAADDYGRHFFSQSEAQIRTLLAGYVNDANINIMISKLKFQGWVFYGKQPPEDGNDFADIIGIIKE
jgi:hypothetical protein